jgi:hypothetical protein
MESNRPDDPLVLLLPNVGWNLAVHLSCAQSHGQRLCHVFLNGGWDVLALLVRGADPDVRGSFVLELALTKLRDFGARNEGKDDIGGETFFDVWLNAQCIGCVDENASMLRGYDRVDHGGEIVDIGQCLDAENDIIEGSVSSMRCLFGASYNMSRLESLVAKRGRFERDAVLCDVLIAGFPDEGHVASICGLQPPWKKGGNGIAANWTDVH